MRQRARSPRDPTPHHHVLGQGRLARQPKPRAPRRRRRPRARRPRAQGQRARRQRARRQVRRWPRRRPQRRRPGARGQQRRRPPEGGGARAWVAWSGCAGLENARRRPDDSPEIIVASGGSGARGKARGSGSRVRPNLHLTTLHLTAIWGPELTVPFKSFLVLGTKAPPSLHPSTKMCFWTGKRNLVDILCFPTPLQR